MSLEVDQIKEKLDVVGFIGSYVKLEKSGASYKGRCPFHNEKTPSFFVSPERQSYYCFGCGAKGDVFTFVEQFEGLDFRGALKVLADRAGVELSKFSGNTFGETHTKDDKEKLFSVVEQACFYFEKNFSESESAKQYLETRGLNVETIKNFRIGLALDEWRGLHDFLISKGASLGDMERAGLVKQGEKGTVYDTFRSRIIFPLADSSGRVVAFSGRIFPDDPNAPKYLNSPETPIFRKSEILFGLDKAKMDIRRLDYSILVEGQMDLVMLHQSGLTNTVASSGTALTENHLKRLSRLSNRIVLAFDGDNAGLKAIFRAAEIALALGMEVKVVQMPEGVDPADLALQDKENLLQVFKQSKHVISFALARVLATDTDERTQSRKIASEVLPLVALLTVASEQSHFIKEIAQRSGIGEEALRQDLKRVSVSKNNQRIEQTSASEKNTQEDTRIALSRLDMIIQKLVRILWWQKGKATPDIDVADLEKQLLEFISPEILGFPQEEAIVFETEIQYTRDLELLGREIPELLASLKTETLKQKSQDIQRALIRARATEDTQEETRLLYERNELLKKQKNNG